VSEAVPSDEKQDGSGKDTYRMQVAKKWLTASSQILCREIAMYEVSPDSNRTRPITRKGDVCEVA